MLQNEHEAKEGLLVNNIARLRIPSILALSVVVLTFAFAACGGTDEAREDVPALPLVELLHRRLPQRPRLRRRKAPPP